MHTSVQPRLCHRTHTPDRVAVGMHTSAQSRLCYRAHKPCMAESVCVRLRNHTYATAHARVRRITKRTPHWATLLRNPQGLREFHQVVHSSEYIDIVKKKKKMQGQETNQATEQESGAICHLGD